MAEQDASQDNKQLPATERRLRKAAEEGQVVRSRDLTHAVALGAAVLGFEMTGRSIGDGLVKLMRDGLRFTPQQALDSVWMARRLSDLGAAAFDLAWPLLVGLTIAVAAAAAAPGGVVPTLRPLMPNLSRIDPKAGFGRIFSKDALVNLGKLFGIAVVLTLAAWALVSGSLEVFAGLAGVPLISALPTGFKTLLNGLAALAAVLALVAFIDVPWRPSRYRAALRS